MDEPWYSISTDDSVEMLVEDAELLVEHLGATVAKLREACSCRVNLEVYYEGGSQSMQLHDLNGEFRLEIGEWKTLTRTSSE